MYCIRGESPDNLFFSMKTGAIIALQETWTLSPSTSTCPSICLSQQFQQQHQL
jgi:hypothetical protein